MSIQRGNQRGHGNGNAGKRVVQPRDVVSHQDDRTQLYAFLGQNLV